MLSHYKAEFSSKLDFQTSKQPNMRFVSLYKVDLVDLILSLWSNTEHLEADMSGHACLKYVHVKVPVPRKSFPGNRFE